MNTHKNARTTVHGRLLEPVRRVIEEKQPVAMVAADLGTSPNTVYKWLRRWRAGRRALAPRPELGARSPTPDGAGEGRRDRASSPSAHELAGDRSPTHHAGLDRDGDSAAAWVNRLRALESVVPVICDEREKPGELLHLDTKKLGRIEGIGHRITGRRSGAINRHRGIGWDHLHVCIDDASRLAYTRSCPTIVRKAPLRSLDVRSPGSADTASRCNAS